MKKLFICLLAVLSSFIINFTVYAQGISESDWVYTIKPNDTFYSIYRKYLALQSDIVNLSDYNKRRLSDKLFPGQKLNIPVKMLRKIPAPIDVLVFSGDVQSRRVAEDGFHALKKGELLAQGDALQTGKYSVAKLSFADGSVLDLQQNSKITIDSSYQFAGKGTYVILLKLHAGKTEISANPNHLLGNSVQVQTPSAIAAVRGTKFRVAADDEVSIQETLSGNVNFGSAGQSVAVLEGYGSLAEKNKAPLAPVALPASPDVSQLPTMFENEHGQAFFELISQENAVVWNARLYSDEACITIINEVITKIPQLKFDDLADGQYFLKIRAQDQHGLSGADALHIFSIKYKIKEIIPPSSILLSPDNSAEIALAPTVFSWNFTNKPKHFILQISRDVAFNDIVFEHNTSLDNVTIQQSFGQGKFYWRVVAVYDGQPNQLSDSRYFTR